MEMITLNNGVKMPIVGFGTYKVTERSECETSIIEAVKAGYRMIDTAQLYDNEEVVGSGIKKSGISRNEIFITTKVWFNSYEENACRASLNKSMRKLDVDYLDIVLLHWPFGNVYAAWRVLEEYYDAGKIRAIGVSNMEADRFIDLIAFNRIKPAVNQIETHLYCQRKEEHKWMEKYDIAHQAYSPLGQGRAKEMFDEVLVREIAIAHGKTPAQVLLRFLIQNGISIIPKSTHPERIKENIDIFDFSLTKTEMEQLSKLDTARPMIGNAEDPNKVESEMTW